MFELRFLTDRGTEESVELVSIEAARKFYADMPDSYTTISFKSLESGGTVE